MDPLVLLVSFAGQHHRHRGRDRTYVSYSGTRD